MKVSDIIPVNEMPLKHFEPVGDFDKRHSFRDKKDRKMITNPRFKEIVAKKFSKTDIDVNLFFVNTPEAKNHRELGVVTPEFIQKEFGDELLSKINAVMPSNTDSFTVVFTNNAGNSRVNMTPWIMAHRIGHAASRFSNSRRQNEGYSNMVEAIDNTFKDILTEVYGVRDVTHNGNRLSNSDRPTQLAIRALAHAVGTFKSARDNNLRDYFELYNELFAQYMITGKVSFKPLPPVLVVGRNARYSMRKDEHNEHDDHLPSLERTLDVLMADVMSTMSGNILVM